MKEPGMDARSRRRFVSSMMTATAAAMGGPILFAAPGGQTTTPAHSRQSSHASRAPGPRASCGFGTGIERQPGPNTWDLKEHTRLTMDNVKASVERLGGTMSDFLYFQVFFCLRSDDSTPFRQAAPRPRPISRATWT